MVPVNAMFVLAAPEELEEELDVDEPLEELEELELLLVFLSGAPSFVPPPGDGTGEMVGTIPLLTPLLTPLATLPFLPPPLHAVNAKNRLARPNCLSIDPTLRLLINAKKTTAKLFH